VMVYFLPRDWTASKQGIIGVSQMLLANLFMESDGKSIYQEETYTDASGKFLLQSELSKGRFDVIARIYDVDGNIIDETLPSTIEVGEETAAGIVKPYQLDEQTIDVEDLQIVMIENSRPILYGKATNGYEVESLWASELFSSHVIMDADINEPDFVMIAPVNLEEGDHKVVVHGFNPLENLYTAAINVDFMVTGGIVEMVEQDTNVRMKVIGVGLGSVLIVMMFWLIAKTHKQRFQ